jgi:diamine N-acetyltransferase
MRPVLSLRPWTTRREEVMAIEVTEEQKGSVDSSVAEFLPDDDDHPTFTSQAVCDGDAVVGFACYGQEVEHEHWRWWIPLVVIDRRHQRQGYGRKAMEAIIARIRQAAPDCRAIGLSCKPDNVVAMRLYRSLGFEPVRDNSRGSVDMWLTVDPSLPTEHADEVQE